MGRLVSFIAAEGVAIDQLSGRITAFNMIEHVAVASLPSLLLRLTAVSSYELGDSDSFVERVVFVGPSGQAFAESTSEIALAQRVPGQLPNAHRSLHSLWRLPLHDAGDYHLLLERKAMATEEWEALATLCITVVVQPHSVMNAQGQVTVPPPPDRAGEQSGPQE